MNKPVGVCIDGNNNVYVADLSNGRIVKWAPNATQGVVVAGGNGSGSALNQLAAPFGIFVDSNGNIYVSDQANNNVVKWAQ